MPASKATISATKSATSSARSRQSTPTWKAVTKRRSWAKADEEARRAGADGNGDGEAGELCRLFGKVSLADYLGAAVAGGEIRSAPAELNAALEVPVTGKGGGVGVPWQMLEIRMASPADVALETRAFTTTGNE